MSRNDQVTRQWFLLQALERPGGMTITQLVQSLPADFACHARTIRRDLEALSVRFPIYTDRVDGEVRWKLVEGFSRVPAVQFSATELMALVFSSELMKPLEGTAIKDSFDSALAKASNALPQAAGDYVQALHGWFSVRLGPYKHYRTQREVVEQLAQAIAKHRTIEMRYYSASRDVTTRRKVDPYHLWYAAGALYLIGRCHLRREVRMFAVDRIRSLTLTTHPCQLPLGFNVDHYVRNALVVMRGGELIDVELRFDRKTSAWAKDRNWHPSQKATIGKDGCLNLRLQVADTPELAGWILSFGGGVRVHRPESLRTAIRTMASEIANAI